MQRTAVLSFVGSMRRRVLNRNGVVVLLLTIQGKGGGGETLILVSCIFLDYSFYEGADSGTYDLVGIYTQYCVTVCMKYKVHIL